MQTIEIVLQYRIILTSLSHSMSLFSFFSILQDLLSNPQAFAEILEGLAGGPNSGSSLQELLGGLCGGLGGKL